MSETPQDEKKISEIAGFARDVYRVALSENSIFGSSADARVHQYDTGTRQQQRVFAAHRYPVYALALHSATGRLATGSHDGQVIVWKIDSGEQLSMWKLLNGD